MELGNVPGSISRCVPESEFGPTGWPVRRPWNCLFGRRLTCVAHAGGRRAEDLP